MLKPKKLKEIEKFLIKESFNLSSLYNDGRINSSLNEDEIIKLLIKNFEIDIPKSREWYDFSFNEKGIFYPVNIKVTDTTHSDNLNCKLGIYYCLTGKIPDFPNETSWSNFFSFLSKEIRSNNRDYYFLIVNKKNNNDIFINSLKSLNILQPNGNNLPFQCLWDKNRKPENRSYEDAKKMILTFFGKSIKLRAKIYIDFKKYFSQYVD